ncbi:beta strand repeat-containing protein [Ottowia thiooxydans]|uniref:beta strand repeat-containing protein n=1 Tax=Ottowia thiooxydans TaxID=219182 RepID=UPI0004112AFC|nr:hypothetical protein [Ottowia thiooxydans]
MQISLPNAYTYRRWLGAALLSLSALAATAATVTGIQGKQGSTVWSSSTSGVSTTAVSTELLSFTANGTRYSTGVDDGMLSGTFTAANFQAFVPLPSALTPSSSTLTAWGTGMTVPTPYPSLTWFLSDGNQGLELATAVFNSPVQTLSFPISIPNSASLTLPAILTTQVGDAGSSSDVYYFVNASGVQIGTQLTVSYGSVPTVGQTNWRFYTATGGTSSQAPGLRPLRMLSYTLADFGLNAATVGNVAAFRQVLSGQSDLAFVAYNRDMLAIQAPDLAIDLTNLSSPMLLGSSYSGSFTCTNIGSNSATVSTSCAISNLPAGLSVSACAISGGGAWVAGNAVPVNSIVTCAVSGTPTVAGIRTVSGSTNGSSVTVVGGNPVTTADSDMSNNTETKDLNVLAPDMQVTSVNLPGGVEGVAYSGSYVCTNAGTAVAANATCLPSTLPSWASVICTPAQPVNPLGVNATIACSVTGTPPTGSNGTTAVTISAGTSSAESNSGNNTGTGNIVILGVPDMQFTSANLPTATVGIPYSGSFVCTNGGTAAAAGATCAPAGLPAWASVSCTPTPPVASLGINGSISCTVSGTPALGDKGAFPVSITAGPASPDSNPGNNTGTASLVVVGVPDMQFTSLNLPASTVGTPYSGSFVCTNAGTEAATAATCSSTGMPAWATVICTPTPPVSSLAINSSISCAVTGTPTVNDKGTSAVTVTAGPNSPDSNPGNNTGTGNIVITGQPDMRVTTVNLPAVTVGTAYSGSFVCSNAGTEVASAATCSPVGIPAWASVACTPAPPVSSLAINATISCTVTGTPTVNDKGIFPVTITAGTSSTESNPNNNTGTGNIEVTGQPDMRVTSVNLPAATVGAAYSGNFVCTNTGTEVASAATCSPAGIPAWASVACTPAPPVSALAINATISCTVTGTPTIDDKVTSPVTITAGTSSTESNPNNNTGTGSIVVTGMPDMRVTSVVLPPALVGVAYSGSFVCTNSGTEVAAAATCTSAGLPAWTTVTCTPPSPVASLAINATISCTVTGTPTIDDKGTSPVTITAGTSSTESNPNNNTGTGGIDVTGLPDMQVTSVVLPAASVGAAYLGSFVCTNAGTEVATAATCTPAGVPAWATVTCNPVPPVSSLAANGTISCTVTGTPALGDKGSSAVTITAGTSATESNPDNNTGSGSIVVTGMPDMQVTSVVLPPAKVGDPYSGSFVCTNAGTEVATVATCTPAGVPAWATVTCTPASPVASLAINGAISCTVSGTPATGDKGTSPVTITAGTSSTEANPDNNAGTGSIVVTGEPNVVIDLSGLPPTGTVNQRYSGTFTCENTGTADAEAAPCTVSGLPTGLRIGACTITPGTTAWSSPSTIPEGQTVTCAVSGAPTSSGTSEVTGTGGTNTATGRIKVAAAAITAVPTMTEWVLILMSALLAGLGLAGARHMKRAG